MVARSWLIVATQVSAAASSSPPLPPPPPPLPPLPPPPPPQPARSGSTASTERTRGERVARMGTSEGRQDNATWLGCAGGEYSRAAMDTTAPALDENPIQAMLGREVP